MDSIKILPKASERAIIINCGTSLSTTLSILSVLRYCNMPLLVIDCVMPDDTYCAELSKLKKLRQHCNKNDLGDFELIQLPLRKHGETLDYIFQNINSDKLLLVDSDIEVLNADYLAMMRKWIRLDGCFGTGFTQGPKFGNISNGAFPQGYYCKRMWIPFVLLDVSSVRKAIAEGKSFVTTRFFNDFPWNQRISSLIYKYRQMLGLKLNRNFFRKLICGNRPDMIIYDAGANIYDYLTSKGGDL